MLGRGVAERLAHAAPEDLFAPELVDLAHEADVLVLNLECAISDRGRPWPDPAKPFFFRAPPVAVRALSHLGVSCATLANNHALDFGVEALLDTLGHLRAAGIAPVGAGRDVEEARAPALLVHESFRLAVLGLTDHPEEYAATREAPGVAYADLRAGSLPPWVVGAIRRADADAVLVTPHWGPNMAREPVPHVRRAARALLESGATLVAGHSAHVFHGVQGRVLFDLGDFLDDYAVDPLLRNDLGLFFLVRLDERGPAELEAVPLALEFCRTRLARGREVDWIRDRFTAACAKLGTTVKERGGRLTVAMR